MVLEFLLGPQFPRCEYLKTRKTSLALGVFQTYICEISNIQEISQLLREIPLCFVYLRAFLLYTYEDDKIWKTRVNKLIISSRFFSRRSNFFNFNFHTEKKL